MSTRHKKFEPKAKFYKELKEMTTLWRMKTFECALFESLVAIPL